MNSLKIQTQKRYQLIDITDKVEKVVTEKKLEKGICLIFAPHSTCAIILTESESRLKNDWINFLQKKVNGFNFEHNQIDNNADSHLLSGVLGQGKTLPIQNRKLVRGTWQQIFLVELDGPREREITIKILEG